MESLPWETWNVKRQDLCGLVLTSFRNVVITLIHRDGASQIASIRRYFAYYPQQVLAFLERGSEREAIFK